MQVSVFLKCFVTDLRSVWSFFQIQMNILKRSSDVTEFIHFFHFMVGCENPKRGFKCVPVIPLVLRLCHISHFILVVCKQCCLKKKKCGITVMHASLFSTSVNVQPWLQCHNALSAFTFSPIHHQ